MNPKTTNLIELIQINMLKAKQKNINEEIEPKPNLFGSILGLAITKPNQTKPNQINYYIQYNAV